jgi:hypothetical protein
MVSLDETERLLAGVAVVVERPPAG